VQILALFTPEDDGCWRVRVFPFPAAYPIAGLNDAGEARGLSLPDFALLDERMVTVRAGYSKRVHASGVMEVTASLRGVEAMCAFVASLLAARGDTRP
jgi:hypothetical protein